MPKMPMVIPVSDLRHDAARVLEQIKTSSRPLLVTQRGRAVAVMISPETYDKIEEKEQILMVLIQGEQDIAAGRLVGMDEVFAKAERILQGGKTRP